MTQGLRDLLLLYRTWVQFSAPTSGGSQAPVSPAPGNPVPSLLHRAMDSVDGISHRHIHTTGKNKWMNLWIFYEQENLRWFLARTCYMHFEYVLQMFLFLHQEPYKTISWPTKSMCVNALYPGPWGWKEEGRETSVKTLRHLNDLKQHSLPQCLHSDLCTIVLWL